MLPSYHPYQASGALKQQLGTAAEASAAALEAAAAEHAAYRAEAEVRYLVITPMRRTARRRRYVT